MLALRLTSLSDLLLLTLLDSFAIRMKAELLQKLLNCQFVLDNVSLEQRVLVAGGEIVIREGTRFILVLGLNFLQLVALGYTEVSKVALRPVRTLLLSCFGQFELQESLSLLEVDCPLQISL